MSERDLLSIYVDCEFQSLPKAGCQDGGALPHNQSRMPAAGFFCHKGSEGVLVEDESRPPQPSRGVASRQGQGLGPVAIGLPIEKFLEISASFRIRGAPWLAR